MSSATVPPITTGASTGIAKGRPASSRGVSALMYACQQGDVEKVRRLLRAQPTIVEKRDRTGKTALHYCCTSDNICAAQAADILVMAAPDLVESRDEDGFTPLHLAVIAGNMPLVTFLLANNADVSAVDSEKHTVVHWATVCGETAALRSVLAAGAPVSTPDVHGGYPLHYAAQMCGGEKDSTLGLQVLQTLLQQPGIKVNVEDSEGRQPLLWASSAGSAKAVLALIRAGATVDAPDKDGLTALHCAASRGHTDCIDTLLTLCGMSADVIDSNGCTALHYSVTLGHADATALLLAHGADPNRQDRKGRSPAHCGCAKGQFETVKLIGNSKGNLWLKNARGDLPLHEATACGRRDLVKWLLEARPSQVNARNNDGRCPLHLAALHDNPDMCKILLDAGAQVNPVLRTSKNIFMTPLDCALQRGFRSTAKYLQLHGGVPANRLSSSKTKIPNGTAGVHVREDLTLWADTTTDSERENGEKEEKSQRRHRRKLAYRYEKKKEPATAVASDDDAQNTRSADGEKHRTFRNGNNKKKSARIEAQTDGKPKENVTYNSEVKITNNYGGINIEKNGEIIIGSDGLPILQGTGSPTAASKVQVDEKAKQISEEDDTIIIQPRESANEEIKSHKLVTNEAEPNAIIIDHQPLPKNDTNNNNRHKTIAEDVQQHPMDTQAKPQINIGDNIEEIKTLATTIEQTAKSITQEVINIQQNLQEDLLIKIKQADQHSLLSNTSFEESEHKELVVEASVHEPPKETEIGEVTGKREAIEGEHNKKITTAEEGKMEEISQMTEDQKLPPVNKDQTTDIKAIEVMEGSEEKTDTEKPEELTSGTTNNDTRNQQEESAVAIQESQATDSKESPHEDAEQAAKVEDVKKEEEPSETQQLKENKADTADIEPQEVINTDKDKSELLKLEEKEPELLKPPDEELELPKEEGEGESEGKDKLADDELKKDEDKVEEQEKISPPIEKEDISDVSVDTPDTVKLAGQATLEDQKTLDDVDQKIESIDEAMKGEVVTEEMPVDPIKADENDETADVEKKSGIEKVSTEDTSSPKGDKDTNAEGVTAVNMETKSKQEEKKKFLKERKSKKCQDDTPKEKIRRDATPRGDESTNGVKVSRKEKAKGEAKSKEKSEKPSSDRRKMEKTSNGESTKKEKAKDRVSTKAIEKILEVTQCGTSPIEESREKLRKRKKLLDDRVTKKKGRTPIRDSSREDKSDEDLSSSSNDSISRKRHKHKSFTVLENGVEKRRVRIAKSKSPRRSKRDQVEDKFPTDESKSKTKKSKIPISNLRREMSISDQYLDKDLEGDPTETRISLPNLLDERRYRDGTRTDLSALPPPPSMRQHSAYSDNERSASDGEEITRSATRRRRLRKRMKRDSRSAGSDYESSNLIDSGFEPSPRSSRIPKWRNMSERGVCMTSVTQSIQSNIRRYHLERKIFQHLLELKRLQIRSGQHNEAVLVKRAIDDYHNSCVATVGAGKYIPEDYSFKSFEKFLYHSLRKLQKDGSEYLKGLPEAPSDNPLLCTQSTHRCAHAAHAYTGIPCAAYLPKMDHHTIPKIGYPCKPSGFLPHINTKKTVTLELCHGGDKQVISLPTDRLDQNKRYYVTFTVKGNEPPSPVHKDQTQPEDNSHRHAKSV